MKKLWLVLFVLLVITGCQTKRDPDYRMLKDEKYIKVSENRFEFEEKWLTITPIVGGYQIQYSISDVITEVKGDMIEVIGSSCSFKRQPSGLFQTDCDDTTKDELMTYVPSATLHTGQTVSTGGIDGNLIGFIALAIFCVILAIVFGLLGFNAAVLDAYFEFKAMFKLKYSDRPNYAEWYKNQQMVVFRAGFVLSIVGLILSIIFMIVR
jgi:hypothetical protein